MNGSSAPERPAPFKVSVNGAHLVRHARTAGRDLPAVHSAQERVSGRDLRRLVALCITLETECGSKLHSLCAPTETIFSHFRICPTRQHKTALKQLQRKVPSGVTDRHLLETHLAQFTYLGMIHCEVIIAGGS